MDQLELKNARDLKLYVTDLTILCFQTIRELITEFNTILIESGHYKMNKDAMSFLTVFILRDILVLYVEQFKIHVFDATKCDISLKKMGVSHFIRIARGSMSRPKKRSRKF